MHRINKRQWLCAAVLPAILTAGCSSMNNTEKGALGGGAIGAGAGALIGHATGNTGAGAAIGAGVGALTGALVGNDMDKQEQKQKDAIAAAQMAHGPVGVGEVVQMTQHHIGDDVIINQIRSTGSVFNLSANDILYLKENGVSDVVIHEMQDTQYRPRRAYVYGAPAVYYVEPAPPPVRIGFGYTYVGRRW